jgi:hypothetical protein
LTLDQRCDLAVATTEQQVSFPVTRYRSIFDGNWALTDRDGVDDLAVDIGLLRVMARTAHPARASQVLQQLLLQRPTGLNEQAAVDRFV